jgi:hypothetical protein
MRGAFNFDRGIASTRRTSLHRHGLGALRGLKLKAGLKGSETLEAAGMAAASHTQPAVSSMVTCLRNLLRKFVGPTVIRIP